MLMFVYNKTSSWSILIRHSKMLTIPIPQILVFCNEFFLVDKGLQTIKGQKVQKTRNKYLNHN